MTFKVLYDTLGIPKATGVAREAFQPEEKDYVTTSMLKAYYDSSFIAIGQRITKALDRKPMDAKKASKLRVSRGITGLLCNPDSFEENFPVCPDRRTGENWRKFQEKFAVAAEKDNILTASEKVDIETMTGIVRPALTRAKETTQATGGTNIQVFTDLVLSAAYQNWPDIVVYPEILMLHQRGHTIHFQEFRIKISDGWGNETLRSTILRGRYDLVAAANTWITYQALCGVGALANLGYSDVATIGGGGHSLIWADRKIKGVGIQDMNGLGEENQKSWEGRGCLEFLNALSDYASALIHVQERISNCSTEEEVKNNVKSIGPMDVPASSTAKVRMFEGFDLSENSLKESLKEKFAPAPQLTSFSLGKKEKVKEKEKVKVKEKVGRIEQGEFLVDEAEEIPANLSAADEEAIKEGNLPVPPSPFKEKKEQKSEKARSRRPGLKQPVASLIGPLKVATNIFSQMTKKELAQYAYKFKLPISRSNLTRKKAEEIEQEILVCIRNLQQENL